jgi:DNA-binding transcriptional ArsR family regulator
MQDLSKEALETVAAYFQALSEPTRLVLLNLLRGGELNVGQLAQHSGFTPANVSRHMSLLTQQGLVVRESRGTSAYYRIADASVYQLCDLVCGNLARHLDRTAGERALFATAATPAAAGRRKGAGSSRGAG